MTVILLPLSSSPLGERGDICEDGDSEGEVGEGEREEGEEDEEVREGDDGDEVEPEGEGEGVVEEEKIDETRRLSRRKGDCDSKEE